MHHSQYIHHTILERHKQLTSCLYRLSWHRLSAIKGILSCWENFSYVKPGSLVISNQFLICQNSTSNPPKFPKNYFFLVRNSTQMALTAPLFPLSWCQRLQNLNQIGVNSSKILIKLVSTTPKSVPNWCQQLQIFTELGVYTNWHQFDQDCGAVEANLIQILESLTLIWSRFWSCWHFSDFDCGVVDTNWMEKVEQLMPF